MKEINTTFSTLWDTHLTSDRKSFEKNGRKIRKKIKNR